MSVALGKVSNVTCLFGQFFLVTVSYLVLTSFVEFVVDDA